MFALVDASPRDERVAPDAATMLVDAVPERATTRRDDVVPERAVPADVAVAARAFDVVVARRADTPRDVVPDVVPARAADAVVPARADVVGVRETTRRVAVFGAVFVRVKTLIWALDCDGFVPGFNCVRIVLFMYGYKLLYVFALI